MTLTWPGAAGVGAIRFARRTTDLTAAVAFYEELLGLPLLLTFDKDDGPDAFAGAIFGMPGTEVTFELVESVGPVAVDVHEQLVLYFAGPAERDAVVRRMESAGLSRRGQYHYWDSNDAVTFADPDGREVVLAPWVFDEAAPPARAKAADPEHEVRRAEADRRP